MAYFPIKCVQRKTLFMQTVQELKQFKDSIWKFGGKDDYATFSWINATNIVGWVGKEAEMRGIPRRN